MKSHTLEGPYDKAEGCRARCSKHLVQQAALLQGYWGRRRLLSGPLFCPPHQRRRGTTTLGSSALRFKRRALLSHGPVPTPHGLPTYVGYLLHSVAYGYGVACCATVLHTLGAVAYSRETCPTHPVGNTSTNAQLGCRSLRATVSGAASTPVVLLCVANDRLVALLPTVLHWWMQQDLANVDVGLEGREPQGSTGADGGGDHPTDVVGR